MTMVERVARAIEECGRSTSDAGKDLTAGMLARAAIEAMREPSDSMLCAALNASLEIMAEAGVDGLSPFASYPPPVSVTHRAYSAMIDAALKDKAHGPTKIQER